MIKINLLPQRKPKRAQAEPGSRALLYGIAALLGVGVLVFVAVDRPRRHEIAELEESSKAISAQIREKTKAPEGYDAMKASVTEAEKRNKSINTLIAAKAVPANLLHELGEIMLTGHPPTMTPEMLRLTNPSQQIGDANKQYQQDWDASHVWLSSFTDETNGDFKLEGGAQSEGDVTQLSKRLAASVYFDGVVPAGGERVTDPLTGVTYYKFTITGKVAF